MWRPKSWKNPYHKYILRPSHNIQEVIGQYSEAAYEAGADAILKALKEQGNRVDFIPDEEVTDET